MKGAGEHYYFLTVNKSHGKMKNTTTFTECYSATLDFLVVN